MTAEDRKRVWGQTERAFSSFGAEHEWTGTRVPGMHKTDTIDYIIVLQGKVTLVLDNDETELVSAGPQPSACGCLFEAAAAAALTSSATVCTGPVRRRGAARDKPRLVRPPGRRAVYDGGGADR